MATSDGEERTREIENAAREYLANRWQRLAAIYLLLLPDLLTVAAVALLLPLVFSLFLEMPLWGLGEGVRWALLILVVALLAVCAVTWDRRLELFQRRLRQQPAVAAPDPRDRPRHMWLWYVLAPLPGLSGFLLTPRLDSVAPRAEMLAVALYFVAWMILVTAIGWITSGRRRFPFQLLGAIVVALWTLAVHLGLPTPAYLLAPQAETARILLPIGLILALWILSAGLYGHLQFRRLQRLLAKTAPEGGE